MMRLRQSVRRLSARALPALLLGLFAAQPACAQQDASKQPLADALRTALAKEPPSAVEKRFTEALRSSPSAYVIDMEALNRLGIEYTAPGPGSALRETTSSASTASSACRTPARRVPCLSSGSATGI